MQFMNEMKTPEEVNNPETPTRRLFPEKWREAWKQFEERVRQRPGLHLIVALAIGYLLQIFPSQPSRASRKALPDIGATHPLSGLRFPAGKICE